MKCTLNGLFAALLLGHMVIPAWGVEIAADYQAGTAGNPASAPSPSALGWTAGVPTSDVANFTSAGVSPDGTSGYNAWRMLDNSSASSQFITWNKTLTPTQHTAAATNGWKLATRLRIVDPVAANGGSNFIVLLYGNNGSKRFILFFDINASGQIVTNMAGGTSVTLTGVDATVYHEHQLIYDPVSATAEYLVDGAVKASGYAGTSGSFNGLQWGTGSTAGKGDGYWNSVSFVINDPPPPPLPTATTHPTSQAVAEGNSVTFTSAFSGSGLSYQWYKDTLPLAGATAASLNLSAVSVNDAGDYWCQATNTTGSASCNTACLAVMSTSGGLVLNEFVAENDSGLRDEDGERSDWIEIWNSSTSPMSTEGLALTDNPTLPTKWPLPTAVVPAGGFLKVWASGKNRTVATGEWHTNFALSNAANGYVALTKPDLTSATAITYPEQFADNSYGLTVHSPARLKYFTLPSAGVLNRDGQTNVKDGLTFAPAGGTFVGSTSVAISHVETSASLRYSTNGRLPEFDSALFPESLTLSSSANLRAALIYPGERFGATASAAYLRLASDLQSFTSPLPIVILSNHGSGAIPGISARGPNGDGSEVVAVAPQAQSLTVVDAASGETAMTSEVIHRSRAGLKIRGSSSFSFSEKSYTMETLGERDGVERQLSLLGMPADADWVIYGPDPGQFDNTLIHNTVAFELARASGFPAPRFRFVELFLDAGGDLSMTDHRGLAILMEKPSRGKDRVDFNYPSNDGSTGGWMISVDRMDSLPPGTALGSIVPRHFHTAGPDGVLQTNDDNPRGYQAILTPGGTGSGSGITPANDDMPNFYHSFFNFEAPDGWSITSGQRQSIQNYVRGFDAALYGANYTNPTNGYWPYIDVKNWAHHLLLQCYVKNQDAVVLSSFLTREKPGALMKWASVWDFDRAYDKNTSNGGAATSNLAWAHDRLFYRRLVTDPEFMQVYSDMWQKLRRGPWATANVAALIDAQAAEITSSVAARSGVTATAWAANIATMKSWLNDRAAAIDALYTPLPTFSHPGGSVGEGFSVSLTSSVGTIYYTTDGSDPRLRGGVVSPSALAYSGPLSVTSQLTLSVRVKNGNAWSALCTASYFPPQNLSDLKLTEIYYNPPGQPTPLIDGEEFEFIELKNTGLTQLDLSGLSFTSGITYTFPANTLLPANGFLVLARNSEAFATRFPQCQVFGLYADKLSNGGETLVLSQAGGDVWTVTYDDALPWWPVADGSGASLQRPHPSALGYDVATWTAAPPTPCADLDLSDTDQDGMADYWEVLNGFVVGTTDGAADADGDGSSNAQEYVAGTDPFSSSERLTLRELTGPSGETAFEFTAIAGKAYTVQTSADLQAWQPYQQVPAGPTTRVQQITDTPSPERKFYRVITPASP